MAIVFDEERLCFCPFQKKKEKNPGKMKEVASSPIIVKHTESSCGLKKQKLSVLPGLSPPDMVCVCVCE